MALDFTEDCMTGIPHIDEEHRMLFQLVNDVNLDLKDGFDVKEILKSLLPQLVAYADFHFKDEEAYMDSIDDPELPIQIQEHNAFREKVSSISFENLSDEEARTAMQDLMQYISRWLYHHILGSDIMIGKMQVIPANGTASEDDDPFAFTEKYLTGIGFVDKEHEKLFEIIRNADELIQDDDRFDKYDQIVAIINELKDYTEKHFSDEEEYMKRIHYEGLETQKRAHEAFVEKIKDINLDELDENQTEYLQKLIEFLLSWLSNHILKLDKQIPST